jgi:hypothetical protein
MGIGNQHEKIALGAAPHPAHITDGETATAVSVPRAGRRQRLIESIVVECQAFDRTMAQADAGGRTRASGWFA